MTLQGSMRLELVPHRRSCDVVAMSNSLWLECRDARVQDALARSREALARIKTSTALTDALIAKSRAALNQWPAHRPWMTAHLDR